MTITVFSFSKLFKYLIFILIFLVITSCTNLILLDYTGYQDRSTIPKEMHESNYWTYGVLYIAYNENYINKPPIYIFFITPPVYIKNFEDSVNAVEFLSNWSRNYEYQSNDYYSFSRTHWILFINTLSSYFSALDRSYRRKIAIEWVASKNREVGAIAGYSIKPEEYELKPLPYGQFLVIDGGSSAHIGISVQDGKFVKYDTKVNVLNHYLVKK